MNELLDTLNVAVQTQSWVTVAAAGALVLVSLAALVLKALKRPVPVLDTILSLGMGLLKVLPKKAPPPPADPSKDGVLAVVKIEDSRDSRKLPPSP